VHASELGSRKPRACEDEVQGVTVGLVASVRYRARVLAQCLSLGNVWNLVERVHADSTRSRIVTNKGRVIELLVDEHVRAGINPERAYRGETRVQCLVRWHPSSYMQRDVNLPDERFRGVGRDGRSARQIASAEIVKTTRLVYQGRVQRDVCRGRRSAAVV